MFIKRFCSKLKIPFLFFREKGYIPSHFSIFIRDVFAIKSKISNNIEHLKATMAWLCKAQDVTGCGGVSSGYSFKRGWQPPYPETTGYIIPTFFDYYHFSKDDVYFERAIKMTDWLCSIQMNSGAFQGGLIGGKAEPRVFNTGQIIQGFMRAYEETNMERHLIGSIKAADWLIKIQDKDGAWRKYVYNGIPHTYHTRVAWPLLYLWSITKEEKYYISALKNINWALSNQKQNGWFNQNAFSNNNLTFTHTIAYAVEGILESGIILEDENYVSRAIIPAHVLSKKFEELKSFSKANILYSAYDENWIPVEKTMCLTGCAQMSVIWQKMYIYTHNEIYLKSALKMNNLLKSAQDLKNKNVDICGGIKGSLPIWGNYQPFSYPNWAAKFFVDALILEEKLTKNI